MCRSLRRIAPLCALVLLQSVVCLESDWWKQTDQQLLRKINYPLRALEHYRILIEKAQDEKPESAVNHTQRYEVLNKSIEYHWHSCLNSVSNYNLHLLLMCIEDRTGADMDTLLHDIQSLKESIGEKDEGKEMTEAEWKCATEEVKQNLPAVKKCNEFYVAVENAKLCNKMNCYDEFWPLFEEFNSNIDLAVANCARFVPRGDLKEFEECCEDLTQPIYSDIESKLLFVNSCC